MSQPSRLAVAGVVVLALSACHGKKKPVVHRVPVCSLISDVDLSKISGETVTTLLGAMTSYKCSMKYGTHGDYVKVNRVLPPDGLTSMKGYEQHDGVVMGKTPGGVSFFVPGLGPTDSLIILRKKGTTVIVSLPAAMKPSPTWLDPVAKIVLPKMSPAPR